jgi:hypothetical protein
MWSCRIGSQGLHFVVVINNQCVHSLLQETFYGDITFVLVLVKVPLDLSCSLRLLCNALHIYYKAKPTVITLSNLASAISIM